MAYLTRSAKDGKDWTDNDLSAYNIEIRDEDTSTFFGTNDLPQPGVDDVVLTTQDGKETPDGSRIRQLFTMFRYVSGPSEFAENAVANFAIKLVDILGYEHDSTALAPWIELDLVICGERKLAAPKLCLYDYDADAYALIVQEGDRFCPSASQASLIASAIAVFCYNNHSRETAGKEPLESKVMPGILMCGTAPIFYKIPVTAALARAVSEGTYPTEKTVISMHVPVLPRPELRYSEGLKPLDNRRAILQCFEAFKRAL
ncbi:hypothetical protein EVG20_g7026 [Dentipellis fragilis]|uniref:Fungal-type protein kinase domain-containing protein n=1 Tax=Dentipellis fragilis TaxID=205917 RepID=A0A4Y9YG42_9AGAM|nr:hypothetical protein EVG20_g7026 [Dentipellis fragilis]